MTVFGYAGPVQCAAPALARPCIMMPAAGQLEVELEAVVTFFYTGIFHLLVTMTFSLWGPVHFRGPTAACHFGNSVTVSRCVAAAVAICRCTHQVWPRKFHFFQSDIVPVRPLGGAYS